MRQLCLWWLDNATTPCAPSKTGVQSWNKNVQLKMAQYTYQFVLTPLLQKFMEGNDKKINSMTCLSTFKNIISLLLLHRKYHYCKSDPILWKSFLKICMLKSWSPAWDALESGEIFGRQAKENYVSQDVFGRDYGILVLSLSLFVAWLCWDEQPSLLCAPIKVFCFVSEMKATGRASMA